ncbi:unnamed protein product [Nippostrongylus brasiliensis]|uniref:Glycosyl hydrolase family protein n=1 Tax=Nippostrongylus brasiliensis TaxID=27835 RepID=A0A158R1S1_NIPBR|nr:unnamed protein product [Nippostrongylus brasiliensis]
MNMEDSDPDPIMTLNWWNVDEPTPSKTNRLLYQPIRPDTGGAIGHGDLCLPKPQVHEHTWMDGVWDAYNFRPIS